MKKIRVGSRDSFLAVAQTQLLIDQIKSCHPELSIELITMKTTGDKILNKSLDKVGGKGLFVKELDDALLQEQVDITVHSLKDMPMELNPDLPLLALSKRGDPRDVLVLPQNDLNLPVESNLGTSSERRKIQLAKLYENPVFSLVRGNIITRLRKLDDGEYSGLILAAAGLHRAGLGGRISRYFETDEVIPPAGQAILSVQGRKGEDYSWLAELNDPDSQAAAAAERGFVTALNGGCSSPIAAHAKVSGNELELTGLYYDEASKGHSIGTLTGSVEQAEALGYALAEKLKEEW